MTLSAQFVDLIDEGYTIDPIHLYDRILLVLWPAQFFYDNCFIVVLKTCGYVACMGMKIRSDAPIAELGIGNHWDPEAAQGADCTIFSAELVDAGKATFDPPRAFY